MIYTASKPQYFLPKDYFMSDKVELLLRGTQANDPIVYSGDNSIVY